MKFSLKVESVCAIGLIIGFFLPWVNIGGFITVTGYQIPGIMNGMGRLGMMVGQKTDPRITLAYIFLYLIPALSIVTIITNIIGKNPALFAGIIPIGGLFYLLASAGGDIPKNVAPDIFQAISIGAYITLISAIGMILSVMGIISFPQNMDNVYRNQVSSKLEFDSTKWNTLIKYDNDIALVVDRLLPFGQKWVDEFASSYLALNDKQYIPEIEKKILAAAEKESMEEEKRTAAILKKREEENEHFRVLAEERQKKYEDQEREREHKLQEEYTYEEQERMRNEYIQTWKNRFFGNKKISIIIITLITVSIVTIVGIILWQKNLVIEEEKSRIAKQRIQIDEVRHKNEELQQQISYEKERIASEKAKINEQQKVSETESTITNTPIQQINRQPQYNYTNEQHVNNQISNVASISSPSIKIGDSYIYESVDSENQKSKITTKRTVISAGDEIVFSTINIGSKKAKPRNLRFNREWNLISTRNAENGGLDYSPPLKYYDFPLYPGKTWQQTTTETDIKTGKTRIHTITGKVGDWEDVTVPAGTFHAIRVNLGTDVFNASTGEKINGTDTSWYVPEVHRSVKSVGIGKDGKQQVIQLLQYELKQK